MNLKEQLLDTLEALAPRVVDKNRAALELEASAVAISCLLSESQGLALVEYIVEELECGKKPIYLTNRFLEKPRFEQLVEHFYIEQKQEVLGPLLHFYHQFWLNQRQDTDDQRALHTMLARFGNSDAVTTRTPVLNVCIACHSNLDIGYDKCESCGGSNLLKLCELSLAQPARDVLKIGQYLEIHVKDCLRRSGIELVGWTIDKHRGKAYTSIRYQVEGEEIDIDVHGISLQPLALLLCEAKTSAKISMNELRRVEGLFNRLIRAIHEQSGKQFRYINLLVTTGEFDRNIPIGAYERKNWELIGRSRIPTLTEELKRIQSEI